MSDGNFHRALLPSTPYASGVKMGKEQMRAKAGSVFLALIKKEFPALADGEPDRLLARFLQGLS